MTPKNKVRQTQGRNPRARAQHLATVEKLQQLTLPERPTPPVGARRQLSTTPL